MSMDDVNAGLKAAVQARLDATPPDDPKMQGYRKEGCCDGGRCHPAKAATVHPSSQAFFDACEQIKAMHASKSRDYGSEHDPLANVRNGAAFVGIPAWKGAMVRLSDKVTRLATFNRTGTLTHEGVEDTLLDLASYSLLALVLYRETKDA